jgi:hypothetical protein
MKPMAITHAQIMFTARKRGFCLLFCLGSEGGDDGGVDDGGGVDGGVDVSGGVAVSLPHFWQKRALLSNSAPQFWQNRGATSLPHFWQKRAPSSS